MDKITGTNWSKWNSQSILVLDNTIKHKETEKVSIPYYGHREAIRYFWGETSDKVTGLKAVKNTFLTSATEAMIHA